MKESAIYLVLWGMMFLMGCGFFVMYDAQEKLQAKIEALQVVVQSNTEELASSKKEITGELQFTNAICEKVLSGEW